VRLERCVSWVRMCSGEAGLLAGRGIGGANGMFQEAHANGARTTVLWLRQAN